MRQPLYGHDLAYVHAAGFGGFAQALAPAIVKLLAARGLAGTPLVELGCGAGAATRHFVAAGLTVTALDASNAMLRLAERAAPGATFVQGVLPDVALPPCAAVVAIGEVVNYLPGAAAFTRLFRRVRRALAPGGLFAFDILEPSGSDEDVTRARFGDDWAVLAHSRERAKERRVVRTIVAFRRAGALYRRSDEVHRVTLLPRADVVARLERLGFRARAYQRLGALVLPARHALVVARRAG